MRSDDIQAFNFNEFLKNQKLTLVDAICPKHGPYKTCRNTETATLYEHCPMCEEESLRKSIIEKRIAHLHHISGVPFIYQEKGLDDYQVTNESQRTALAVASDYANCYQENPSACLIIVGNPGTGKTHLSIGIIKKLINKGFACRYTTIGDVFSSVKSTYSNGTLLTEDEVVESYLAPAMLVIDEIGISQLSRFEEGLLYRIINGRYELGKATIAISNQCMEVFRKTLGERLVDRFRENSGRLISLKHESFRKKQQSNPLGARKIKEISEAKVHRQNKLSA
ncbi:ATP-binding protein [Oligella urethralis]|uniref:DNA replication protein dnaC n=1 Tax=Oligella urethralis TaxID=90245 RepID=A0A2X1UN16_9BURK|nr:ATP-binding protein [Oligella urethralis]SPY08458.1 DNA replication protein dnaC [Oligella urethralis]